jgi:hypothetical protein
MARAILAAACFLLLMRTAAASEPMEAEYQPEVYSQHGQTIGCGISYNVVWTTTEKQTIGVDGSVMFFYPQPHNLFASVKAAAQVNGTRTPVKSAWAGTSEFGKTTDFTASEADVPGVYLAVKYADQQTAKLPSSIAHLGGTLGVTFAGSRLDDTVDVPAAPADVAAKIDACLTELMNRVRQDLGHP